MKTHVSLLTVVAHVLLVSACVPVPQAAAPAAQASAATAPTPAVTPVPAAATPAAITVTFSGNKCAYDGTKRVPAGKLALKLETDAQDKGEHLLFVGILDAGKTIDDLLPVPALPQPEWIHQVGGSGGPFSGNKSVEIDANEGPLYLVCFTWNPLVKIGALGPIEVVQ